MCRQLDIEFSIVQPLGYATNHKDAPLSHNVALITSYKRGFNTIHFILQFSFGKELLRIEVY